jgi:dTMP kinase
MSKRGLLIAFEGIDGTGKSTQIALLAEYLATLGHEVVTTREPTDGVYGQKIRSMFASRHELSSEEELELFMNDRREHIRELISPALAAGKIVLTDRYYFSTVAYQGAAGHDPVRILAENESFAPVPDLVMLLTLSTDESARRIRSGRGEVLNDFEQEEELARVAAVFDGLEMDYIKRIDASGSPEMVHKEIVARMDEVMVGRD